MISLIVEEIRDETSKIREFTFRASSGQALPAYTPGAHIDFELGEYGRRSYSLIDWDHCSDAPNHYRIAVQREEYGTGGSKAMHAVKVGQTVHCSIPTNDFELELSNEPILLLAGGIGVTPLISMGTKLLDEGKQFAFHYIGRSAELMGYHSAVMSKFSPHAVIHFDDQIPIDIASVMAAQAPNTHVYICGPKGMIDAARSAAMDAGLSESNIHVELFFAPEEQSTDFPFEVEISGSGQVFTIPVGKSIIEVLEDGGVDLMFDCQRGDCGICQTDVISGVPDHRDVILSEAEREQGKVMQICVSRAKSPRLVLDI